MNRTSGSAGTYYRTALFVDFDNVYIRLAQQDPAFAQIFATQPGLWIGWLEDALSAGKQSTQMGKRRILVRRCYLNPRAFGKYRPYFIRSAFETVDCPTLTSRGKTSADVYMVLDILELLSHETFFDEFILLSADADFTPVLLKLRKHDRHTVVLAIGPSSTAYTAASDVLINQDDFLAALGASDEPAEAGTVEHSPKNRLAGQTRDELSKVVRNHVTSSANAVPLAAIAHQLRVQYPALETDWGGFGSFNALLSQLHLGHLVRSYGGPGYLYDPSRHTAPDDSSPSNDAFAQVSPEIKDVAKRVAELTDTPFLSPDQYAKLFNLIAADINANGYHMTRVSKTVRDECAEKNMPIGRQHINFVLRGIAFAGHRFGEHEESAQELAQRYRKNTLNLCAQAQLELTGKEEQTLSLWLTGRESDDSGEEE